MASQTSSEGAPFVYLVPENSAARRVVDDERNASWLRTRDGEQALALDFSVATGHEISLGRAGCDITLPNSHGAAIDRRQCLFKYNSVTGAVILNDVSRHHTTQVDDPEEDFAVPMSRDMKSVVVSRGFNRNLSIGSQHHYRFKLVWEGGADPVRSFLSRYPNHFGPDLGYIDPAKVRYLQGEVLGYGTFGIVWKTVNIHTGKAMAVKRFLNLEGRRHVLAVREVNNMLRLSANNARTHDHILPILDVAFDRESHTWIEVFMPLMDGSVKKLIELPDRAVTDDMIGQGVLYQMALALKFMAKHRMVHRDIKPDNILYMVHDGGEDGPYYHYKLADFNLSNETAMARTQVGTPLFMSPEVYARDAQTSSTDIWSLFVTLVWIYNTDNFRDFYPNDRNELIGKIQTIAEYPEFENIRDMAHINPKRRVSARRLVERLSDPEQALAAHMGAMMLSSADDEGAAADSAHVPSISEETAQSFAQTYSGSYATAYTGRASQAQRSHPATQGVAIPAAGYRDGMSAMVDLGYSLHGNGSPTAASGYRAGQLGHEYELAGHQQADEEYEDEDHYPRTDDTFDIRGTIFSAAGEDADGDNEIDEAEEDAVQARGVRYTRHYTYMDG